MDPYVLALQLYLFNKACGGIPLRIAEQVVVSGVLNATYWTAKQIGSGVLWLVWPSGKSRELSSSNGENNNLEAEFEIINPDDIPDMAKLRTINDEIKNDRISECSKTNAKDKSTTEKENVKNNEPDNEPGN